MATRSGASRSTRSTATTGKGTAKRRSTGSRAAGATTRRASATRADKSLEAFRDALERSVTLSRDRLQEVVDDAVARGRMTRDDANELVSNLVSRGRKYTEDLVRDLERLIDQARRELETRTTGGRRQAERAATRARRQAEQAARTARDVADQPLARADALRRRARVGGFPITAYDSLTASQVKSRLGDLKPAELRKVRDYERRSKARKGILSDIERRLK